MAYGKRRKQVDMSTLPLDKQRSRAYDYCIWHLSQTDRTEKYLREKMRGKNYVQEVIDSTVNALTDAGLLDDDAYAERYMERSDVQKMGKRAISYKLRNVGIEQEKIDELLDSVSEDDERSAALELAQKKYDSFPADLPEQKQKSRLLGLLSRRGFSGDVVFSVVSEVMGA